MTATQLLRPRAERETRRFVRVGRSPAATSVPTSRPSIERSVVVHCAGQDFLVKKGMAEIFLRHARNILSSGTSELTPLLHAGGLDLVLITPSTGVACLVDGRALVNVHGALDPVLARQRGLSR